MYWALPVIATVFMSSLIVSSGGIYETFNGSQHVSCEAEGVDAVVTPSAGAEQYEATCLDAYEYVVVEQSSLGKLLLFAPTLAAFAALAFMRSAQKGLEHDETEEGSGKKATEARAIAIGFGGKAFFQGLMVVFMVYITIKFGTFNTVDLLK